MKRILSVLIVAAAMAASAASSYVTPWYVNPALKERCWLGVASFTPTDLAIGANGTRLAVATEPAASFGNIRVFDLGNLIYSAGEVQTNRHVSVCESTTVGLNAAPILAAHANDLIGIDVAGGTAVKFPLESKKWAGRYAPEARAFSAAPDATSFALDSSGALWSNATGAGREGLLVKRTLSGAAYAEADAVDTGLTAVDAVAVYTVNGTEYALAAGQGKVVRVNVSTKAVATLVDDATHLNATVKAMKMSHTDYFRPRLYMLLASGDIATYYLNETATTATWSKTLSNAELLTVAQAPYATDAAVIAAFEVTPDGGSAFLAYRANDGATATGPCYLVMVKNSPPRWTYYAKGAAGNPGTESATYNCITDGKWVLRCDVSGGNLTIGVGTQNETYCGNAWDGDYMGEYLDLSSGRAYAPGGTTYNIVAAKQWALGHDSAGRQPRVIVHTTLLNDFHDKTKGWSAVEEVVVDSIYLTYIGSWTGLNKNIKRIVINAPNATRLDNYALNNNNSAQYYPGTWSDFGDFNLSTVATVGYRAVGCFACTGVLNLPAAKMLKGEAFHQCRYLEEVRLGTAANTLECISNGVFTANWFSSGSLKRVTLGGVEGFMIGANVFDNQPLEEVVFTGGRPTFTSATAFQDKAARTMTF